ncbi:hypothetical protein D3C76_1598060 [compost metagenome]
MLQLLAGIVAHHGKQHLILPQGVGIHLLHKLNGFATEMVQGYAPIQHVFILPHNLGHAIKLHHFPLQQLMLFSQLIHPVPQHVHCTNHLLFTG